LRPAEGGILGYVNRAELGAALRGWRERIAPTDVGLPARTRRRTPGLRREEVAQLAGVSVDYLTRMEQGRGAHPSDAVLAALARALRLNPAERDHLFHLAGGSPPLPGRIGNTVRPSVLRLMDRFTDLPALLINAKLDILTWNPLAAALLGDFSELPPAERNVAWQRFVAGGGRVAATDAERARLDLALVADLRDAAARYPNDPGLRTLVDALLAGSSEFAALWARRPVRQRHDYHKRFAHPEVGVLELDCDQLHVPGEDQTLVVYSAAEGSREAEALALLRVLGTQRLGTPG
jgi:transcriptional regulator with XRE-family HTH domain